MRLLVRREWDMRPGACADRNRVGMMAERYQKTNRFGFTAVYADGTTMPYRYPTQDAADLAQQGFEMDERVVLVREIRPEDPIFLDQVKCRG
jgi:hypothetical protein